MPRAKTQGHQVSQAKSLTKSRVESYGVTSRAIQGRHKGLGSYAVYEVGMTLGSTGELFNVAIGSPPSTGGLRLDCLPTFRPSFPELSVTSSKCRILSIPLVCLYRG